MYISIFYLPDAQIGVETGAIEDAPLIAAPAAVESTQKEVPTDGIVASKLLIDNATIATVDEATLIDAPTIEPTKKAIDPIPTNTDHESKGDVSETSSNAEKSDPSLG